MKKQRNKGIKEIDKRDKIAKSKEKKRKKIEGEETEKRATINNEGNCKQGKRR